MKQFKALFQTHEDQLMERILELAKRQGYTKYTSTLIEAWRISIAGLTKALIEAVDAFGMDGHEFTPEDTFENDPVSAFAVREAELHRQRGISLAMFMGLLKYYRQAYLDLVQEQPLSPEVIKQYGHFVERFFDRLEIALCVDWTKVGDSEQVAELQARNRLMVNEKNKFLTLLESLYTPIFLLDSDMKVETMNLAAAELVGLADHPGQLHYAPPSPTRDQGHRPTSSIPLKDVAPWLADIIERSCALGKKPHGCRFEVCTPPALGTRYFSVSISSMSDISDKFTGFAITLDDITYRLTMEKELEKEHDKAKHYLDVVGSILLALDASANITLINKAGCQSLGYTEEELVGKNWIDTAIPLEQRDDVQNHFQNIFYGHTKLEDEHVNYVTTKNGEHRLIAWRNSQLRDESGRLTGVLCSGIDITEQRLIEEALAEKELWLRNTFLALGEAVLILTPDRTVIDANPAALDMFQIAEDELTGTTMAGLHIDEKQHLAFDAISQQAFDRGETAQFEFSMQRKHGEIFPAEHVISLIHSDDGTPLGIVNVIRDISERKKAELSLIQSEEKFRRIFNTIEEGYVVTDLDGTVLMVNPATCRILGYDELEVVGADMSMLYASTDERSRFKATLLRKGSVENYILTAIRKDGSTITTEANARLVTNHEGLPIGMEGTFRDITARIQADKILREREEQYRAFFENNHAVMLLVSPETGTIVDANPAASEFYGYSRERMQKMFISDINAQSETEIFQEMADARKEKRAYFIFSHRLADDTVREVEVYSGPIMVHGHQLIYSVIHDVTQRVAMEREMERMATTDALTGASNRHQFFQHAEQELKRAQRYGQALTVMMLDIDYFKSINDNHGHQAGDVVLRGLSSLIINTLREPDIFGRLGGEEFAAVLPETEIEGGMLVAERLRHDLASLTVKSKDAEISFTVSIGVTEIEKSDMSIEEAINRADEALYRAKRTGRNRVVKG